MAMIQILAFLDCLAATTAVTVEGGRDVRLQGRTVLVSGSLVWKTSWEEEEETTAAVTVDTTKEDTIKDTTRVDTTRDTTRDIIREDTIKEDTIRTVVSATTS